MSKSNSTCEICGISPAEKVLLQSASSRIIWWNHRKLNIPLCATCAETAYIQQQSRTLTQGWWGPLSAAATIWFSIANFSRITTHRRAIPFVEVSGTNYPRPILKVRSNPLALILSAIALVIIASIGANIASQPAAVSDSDPTSFYATCWESAGTDQLKQVSCDSSSAIYESYQIVDYPKLCPDVYLAAGSQYACLRNKL